MATSTIDLSSGLVPKQGSPTAAGIDLSAGLVPRDGGASGSWDSSPTTVGSVVSDVGAGIAKGAGQTVNTVSKLLNKIPVVGETLAPSQGVSAAENMETPTNTAQKVGVGIEGLGEFLLGDEALKGLSLGDKLLSAGKLAKTIEGSPLLSKAVEIGMNALRTGTVGAGQALAHGASAGEAATTGAVAAGVGGVLETGVQAVKALAPGAKVIAGTEIPVRASEGSRVASAAEFGADSKALQKFDAEQTQPAARSALGDIAGKTAVRAAEDTVNPLSMSANDFAKISSDIPASVSNFGDAANSIRAASKPVFQKLDQLSSGEFTKAQQLERLGRRADDFEAVQKGRDTQQQILENYKDQFSGPELQQAKANWRQSSALDSFQDSIDKSTHPTPLELYKEGQPDPGYFNGKQLRERILDLTQSGELQAALKDPKHVQDIQDLGRLLENGNNVRKVSDITKGLAAVGQGATAILSGHPAGAAAIAGEFAVSKAMGWVMTQPKAAALLVKGLRSSLSSGAIVTALKSAQTTSEQ
jgi:hypothetical protein